jgi:crotonobetaine/carnitine-CoA ligase
MTELSPLEVLRRYPAHGYTLDGLLRSRASTDPSRPLLIHGGRTWSWQQFLDDCDRLAAVLHEAGVGAGGRVAILAVNSPAHVLLLFAVARIGAILVPINPDFGLEEIRYVLGHSEPSAVICSATALPAAREACAQLGITPWLAMADQALEKLPAVLEMQPAEPLEAPPPSPESPCVIIYSSGTTGFPKGVTHSQKNYVLSAEVHLGRIRLEPDGRMLCMLPLFHVNALFYAVGGAVAAGASVLLLPKFSASGFWKVVHGAGITHTTIMAAVGAILAQRPRSEFVPGHRLGVVNGSGFTPETLRTFNEEFGVPVVIEGYGMSEIPVALANPYEGPRKLGSLGLPCRHPDPEVPWAVMRIVDDEGSDVAPGDTGELIVQTPNIMLGYFRDPAQTAASFRDGWFLTGDLVRQDEDGYYFFVARKKDIIRRRGENIAGAELDRVIGEHPDVAEVAAIGVEAEMGEEVLAAIVKKPGASLTAGAVRAWCADRLAPHKVPRFVVFVDDLPHTSTHKVAKFALKERAAELRAGADDQAVQPA